MKKILIMIAVVYSCSANGQSKDFFIYGETGLGFGTHFSYKAAINSIFDSTHILSICYYFNSRRAPNLPADYSPGILWNGPYPQQGSDMFGVMYGKMLYTNSLKVRYALKGGMVVGHTRTPCNYINTSPGSWFGPIYTYSYHVVFNYGIVLNPTIEFPFGRGFGLSVGLFSIINPIIPLIISTGGFLSIHQRSHPRSQQCYSL